VCMGGDAGEFRIFFASSSSLRTDSCRCGEQLRNANQIVGGRGQDEEPFHHLEPGCDGIP
jgi:hypothetical protein